MQVLVSLHDVSPVHQHRLERAEGLLARAGVSHAAYLVVPDFHGRSPVASDRTFQAWCARSRPFAVDWVLHGYTHQDDGGVSNAPGRALGWIMRRLLTGGEGEFLGLDAVEQRARLRRGAAALSFLGPRPSAFVAPAWLFNDKLVPALAAEGFAYTEDHWRVFDIARGIAHRCPAVTWATRTRARRVGSLVVNPIYLSLLGCEPAIRIAIHPYDMDHRRTADAVARLLDAALARRRAVDYATLCAARAP